MPYADGYAGDFDKAKLGLKALRVEEYRGLIFATFDDTIEPLSDFLGNAKPWIDLFLKQGGGFQDWTPEEVAEFKRKYELRVRAAFEVLGVAPD